MNDSSIVKHNNDFNYITDSMMFDPIINSNGTSLTDSRAKTSGLANFGPTMDFVALSGHSYNEKSDHRTGVMVNNNNYLFDVDNKVIGYGNNQVKIEDIPFSNEEKVQHDNNVIYGDNKIKGIYYNDLDLMIIDRLVCRKIIKESENIPKIWSEIEKLRYQLKICPNDKNSRTKITKLQTDLKNIQHGINLNEYQNKVRHLLEKYKKIRYNNVSEFGQESNFKPDPVQLDIISQYIQVAKLYITIDLLRLEDNEDLCNGCKTSLKDICPDIDGKLCCPVCRTETIPLQREIVHSDPQKQTGKGGYDDIKTFIKAIECYIGGQQVTFPEHLTEQLDEYFESINMAIGEEISEMPLKGDFKGRRRRGNTSRSLMIQALQSIGVSDHYKDSYLLCRNYWGWENPDLSGVYNLILHHYKETQPIYNKLKEIDGRKSSLGSGYRLFRHLWHIGYPCHPSEFCIVQTEDILIIYENIWKQVCDIVGPRLGWRPFISIRILFMIDPDTLELPIRQC